MLEKRILDVSKQAKESGEDLSNTISDEIENHLHSLAGFLHKYFPNLRSKKNFMLQNPFKIMEMPIELTVLDYKSLIEHRSDGVQKAKFVEFLITLFLVKLI